MFTDTSLQSPTEQETSDTASTRKAKTHNIAIPHENDVLMGRGGKNNQHSGNEKLREFARRRSEDYRAATKKGKSDISRELVRLMRQLKPSARFLRKDPQTCKWEDVGDDIAREKTSQVLRDAVSEKNGPMAKSKKKAVAEEDDFLSVEPLDAGIPSHEEMTSLSDQRDNSSSTSRSTYSSEIRSHRSSSAYYSHPHAAAFVASMSSVPATPQHPSVTPASASMARKRPRISDSPMSHGRYYGYYTPPSTSYAHSPPGAVLSHAAQRQHFSRPSPGYFSQSSSQYSFSHHRSPASAIPAPYEPHPASGRNEPWVADITSHSNIPRPSVPTSNAFDLYNEDILSDHSDHRDGSVSPFWHHKRDSL